MAPLLSRAPRRTFTFSHSTHQYSFDLSDITVYLPATCPSEPLILTWIVGDKVCSTPPIKFDTSSHCVTWPDVSLSQVCSIASSSTYMLKKETKLKLQEVKSGVGTGGTASSILKASACSTLCKAVLDVSDLCQQLQSQQLQHQHQQQHQQEGILAALTEVEGRYSIPLMPSGQLTFLLQARSLSQPQPSLSPLSLNTPMAVSGKVSTLSPVRPTNLTPLPESQPALTPAALVPVLESSKSSKLRNLLRKSSSMYPSTQVGFPSLVKTVSIQQPETPTASFADRTPKSVKRSTSVSLFFQALLPSQPTPQPLPSLSLTHVPIPEGDSPAALHTTSAPQHVEDAQAKPLNEPSTMKLQTSKSVGSACLEDSALDIEQIKQSLLLLEGSDGQDSLGSLHCGGRGGADSDSSDDGNSPVVQGSTWWSWWKGKQQLPGASHDTRQVHDAIWQMDSVSGLAEMAEDLLSQRDEWRERAVRAEASAAHALEDVEVLRGQRRLMSEALRAVDEELRRYQRGDVTHALILAKMEAAELQAEVEELKREARNLKRQSQAGLQL